MDSYSKLSKAFRYARAVSVAFSACLSCLALSQVNVTTYHNDNARTGLNNAETILTPANVKPGTFGLLFNQPVDGHIYAEPLYLSGVSIPGLGTHNVVYVATEHNSVFAFDADDNLGPNSQPLWQVNLGQSVPSSDTGTNDINPEIGITGTPVIAPAGPGVGTTATLYVVAKTKTFDINSNPVYTVSLHALDATTGAEKFNGPLALQGFVSGTGDGTDGFGRVPFDPKLALQRAGLLLTTNNPNFMRRAWSKSLIHTNGSINSSTVYVAFASHGDNGPYHGWVFSVDANTMQQTGIFNTTPNAVTDPSGYPLAAGGIWQAGAGLASDGASIYCATGNGVFNALNGSYGDSVLRLNSDLTVGDYFAPADQQNLNNSDTDLGSGGVVLLPPEAGNSTHPNLAVAVGKEGSIYLMDTTALGGNDTTNHVVRELNHGIGGVWGVPAYFNGNLYFGPIYGALTRIGVANADFPGNGVDQASPDTFSYPGPVPAISSNGNTNGIVWAIEADTYQSGPSAYLKAYDATNLASELYDSSATQGRDVMGPAVKFSVPTVANGKVYAGANGQLSIFGPGNWAATPTMSPPGGNYINSVNVTLNETTPNSHVYYTLDGSVPTTASTLYSAPIHITISTVVSAKAFMNDGTGPSVVTTATYVINFQIGNGTGLIGDYFANTTDPSTGDPTARQLDPLINFVWNGAQPIDGVGGSNWSARWTGFVQAKSTAVYTFYTNSDDGVRLTVNGKSIIDNWTTHGGTVDSGTITLTGGKKYTITLDYFQGGGGAQLIFFWSAIGLPLELVPASQLYFTFQTGGK